MPLSLSFAKSNTLTYMDDGPKVLLHQHQAKPRDGGVVGVNFFFFDLNGLIFADDDDQTPAERRREIKKILLSFPRLFSISTSSLSRRGPRLGPLDSTFKYSDGIPLL